jgi:hypothetical protein
MTEQPPQSAPAALVSSLLERVGGQLSGLAAGEQSRQTELKTLAGQVTDPERTQAIEAAIAQHAAREERAKALAELVSSRRTAMVTDLQTLLAISGRVGSTAPGDGPGPPTTNGSAMAPTQRLINVAWNQATGPVSPEALAAGYQPMPQWNLTDGGGRTIADLTFVNRYLGGAGAWSAGDMQSIDGALASALSDSGLQTVIAQYYPGVAISSTMLPSATVEGDVPATVYKDDAEALARSLHDAGALGAADPTSGVICMMLPQGIILSDAFSPGFTPAAGAEAEHARREAGVLTVGEEHEAADSSSGLGGYHGSITLADGSAVYYAVGVYSETAADGTMNGLDAFGVPWKNVVATFYHELNEARTDPDVEQANATGNLGLLGWYSQAGGGEIGDLPINASPDWKQPFVEAPLADGSGTVPVQMMWSNLDGGPALSTEVQHA